MGNCHYSKESAFEAEIAVIFLVAVLVTIDYNCNLSMSHRIKRIPFGYDGPLPTGRTLQRLLPKIMAGIEGSQQQPTNGVLGGVLPILGKRMLKNATRKKLFAGGVFFLLKKTQKMVKHQ